MNYQVVFAAFCLLAVQNVQGDIVKDAQKRLANLTEVVQTEIREGLFSFDVHRNYLWSVAYPMLMNQTSNVITSKIDETSIQLDKLLIRSRQYGVNIVKCELGVKAQIIAQAHHDMQSAITCLDSWCSLAAQTGKNLQSHEIVIKKHANEVAQCGKNERCLVSAMKNMTTTIVQEPLRIYQTAENITRTFFNMEASMSNCTATSLGNLSLTYQHIFKNVTECVEHLMAKL